MNYKTLRRLSTDPASSPEQRAYIARYLSKERSTRFWQWMFLIIFLASWEIAAYTGVLNSFIFSSPSRVAASIADMALDGSLFYHLGITLAETFLSFFLVMFLGILAAVLLWWKDGLSKILEPYLIVLNSLPKTALAPIFIVWLGNNMKTIIVAAVSVAVFGTIITLYTAFTSVEEDKIRLIRTLGGSRRDILLLVVLPSNIPSIISMMKVNIGLSLVGVIIGEFLAARAGLGYLIIYGSQVFKLDWVMMSIVILCLVATALYQGLSAFERRFAKNAKI